MTVGRKLGAWLRRKKTKNFEKALAPQIYSYSDIVNITNSFLDEIGTNAHGSVFKGELPDGRIVAVEVVEKWRGYFTTVVKTASETSHPNVVSLLGVCVEGRRRILIYEFLPNGSLDKFIYSGNSSETDSYLCWETLYRVAVGIARGLDHLHRGCSKKIVHFDIKPHNILLDQDFNPKISCFGLAILCAKEDTSIPMSGARGTIGYVAPEVCFKTYGEVTNKADVYGYGMMVLEMVAGRKNLDVTVDNVEEIYFPQWAYSRLYKNEDPYGVTSAEEGEIAHKMMCVGLWCIQTETWKRPSMKMVLQMLEVGLETFGIPPNPSVGSSLAIESPRISPTFSFGSCS